MGIIISRKRMRRGAGWLAHLLFACNSISLFSIVIIKLNVTRLERKDGTCSSTSFLRTVTVKSIADAYRGSPQNTHELP